jgi:hypothetical protein
LFDEVEIVAHGYTQSAMGAFFVIQTDFSLIMGLDVEIAIALIFYINYSL